MNMKTKRYREYPCWTCKNLLRIAEDDAWDKILRCPRCLSVVADNIGRPQPAPPKETRP